MSPEPRKPKPQKRSGLFAVDLLDCREPWLKWCAEKGVKPTSAMRELVRSTVRSRSKAKAISATSVRVHSPERPTERREIALTPSELFRAKVLAESEGFSVPKWLAAVIRARLTNTPQFGAAELDALAESNLRLSTLSRQLHQLNLVLSGRSSEVPEVMTIDQMRREISGHTTKVSRLMASSLERWTVR
ncbi:hypothetical protein [Asticcacaulis sp. W401b]|uniref:hypothetical protein n=1 Tax=Asticcacaulis sp. W401b TaxID=3388666 RepID=UPI0039705553